jgi:hypothetical protein
MMITKWTEDEWLNKLMEDDCVNKTPSQIEKASKVCLSPCEGGHLLD